MPTARSGGATVVFDDRIIVIGGTGAPQAVERYDPATKSWDALPDLPVPLEFPMAAAVDAGTDAGIYVFGGSTKGVASRRSFYLPRDDEEWSEIQPMPDPRSGGAAVAIGRKIYIVGGALSGALALSIWIFDMDGGWSVGPAMPTGRDHLAAVALGGRVCAVGGRSLASAQGVSAFECYDPEANKWEALPPLPSPRAGIGAAVSKDRVVVIGGLEPSATLKQVEVFDARSRTWSRGPDLPAARHSPGVAAVKGVVYALGGGPTPGASQTKECEALTLP